MTLTLLITFPGYAENVRVGRYSSINPVATEQQSNLLSVVVTISFNAHINSVGEAINHLLLRSGYHLASLKASDPMLPVLLDAPLPHTHKKIGPITIENALHMLAGSAWALVVDPVHRLVSFELVEKYQSASKHPVQKEAWLVSVNPNKRIK